MEYVYTYPHRHDLRVFMCNLVTFANLNILVFFFTSEAVTDERQLAEGGFIWVHSLRGTAHLGRQV